MPISTINFLITDYNTIFYRLKYAPSSQKLNLKNRRLKMWCNDNGNESGMGRWIIDVMSSHAKKIKKASQ